MNLKLLRKQAKKTQEELAKMLNTTHQTYGRYELETSEPNIETLCKLADYYNVSLDYLVGREYVNDIGYLPEEKKSVVKAIQVLNEHNFKMATIYIMNLLASQM